MSSIIIISPRQIARRLSSGLPMCRVLSNVFMAGILWCDPNKTKIGFLGEGVLYPLSIILVDEPDHWLVWFWWANSFGFSYSSMCPRVRKVCQHSGIGSLSVLSQLF